MPNPPVVEEIKPQLSFGIIIPMYNEELNAERCVRTVSQTLERIHLRSELIVVNDGSTDNTGAILKGLEGEFPKLTVVTHERNGGYGRAIQTGINQAEREGFNYALFMDSDLTNDPKYIPDFIRKMEEGLDVIKASRYVKGGGMKGVPLHRRLISIVGNKIASTLMRIPLSDCTNGFRAVKVSILSQMPLAEPGFAVIMEELYNCKCLAETFCEIPYILASRGKVKGLSKFTYQPKIFCQYFRYILKAAFVRRDR